MSSSPITICLTFLEYKRSPVHIATTTQNTPAHQMNCRVESLSAKGMICCGNSSLYTNFDSDILEGAGADPVVRPRAWALRYRGRGGDGEKDRV